MKRTFHRDERVTLECRGWRIDAEVVLISPNQEAICFTLEEPLGIPAFDDAMAITQNIPVWQDDAGRLTDLYGNEWRIV